MTSKLPTKRKQRKGIKKEGKQAGRKWKRFYDSRVKERCKKNRKEENGRQNQSRNLEKGKKSRGKKGKTLLIFADFQVPSTRKKKMQKMWRRKKKEEKRDRELKNEGMSQEIEKKIWKQGNEKRKKHGGGIGVKTWKHE